MSWIRARLQISQNINLMIVPSIFLQENIHMGAICNWSSVELKVDVICKIYELWYNKHKMVVRCLLPGKGCWKVLLRNRLQAGTPKYGRPWPDSLNWCCTSGVPPKMACHLEDRVANSILRAWCHIRHHLIKNTPETLIEWTRQPLF